jgi:hypothetical protein
MGATVKKISVILLLVAFLTPGLAQARVFGFEGKTVTRATETGFFNVVWNLLANMFDKNGNMLDPSGCTSPSGTCGGGAVGTGTTTTTSTTDNGDNGNMLDPSGKPQ